jgi:putative transposase
MHSVCIVGPVPEYQTNRGAAYSLGYHLVWCPKYRRPVLVGPVAERLRVLIGQKCDEHGWTIVALEVMPDHVHLFVKANPEASPSHIANQFKGMTSRVLRQEFPELKRRLPTLWSRSYFVSTVGNVSAATVKRYIDTQWERPWRKETGK